MKQNAGAPNGQHRRHSNGATCMTCSCKQSGSPASKAGPLQAGDNAATGSGGSFSRRGSAGFYASGGRFSNFELWSSGHVVMLRASAYSARGASNSGAGTSFSMRGRMFPRLLTTPGEAAVTGLPRRDSNSRVTN